MSVSSYYSLENLLSKDGLYQLIGQENIMFDYPDIEQLLSKFQDLLLKYEGSSVFTTNGQVYTGEVKLFQDDFYRIAWDINYAKAVIRHFDSPVQMLPVEYFMDAVDTSSIETSYLPTALKNDEPIIVAAYPLLGKQPGAFVLDGNHRIYSRYQQGMEGIKGFILKPHQHYYAMISGIHRLLYIIHELLLTLSDYLQGKTELKDFHYYLENLNHFQKAEEDIIRSMSNNPDH